MLYTYTHKLKPKISLQIIYRLTVAKILHKLFLTASVPLSFLFVCSFLVIHQPSTLHPLIIMGGVLMLHAHDSSFTISTPLPNKLIVQYMFEIASFRVTLPRVASMCIFSLGSEFYWVSHTKWRIRESNQRKSRKKHTLSWRDAGRPNSDLHFTFPFCFQLEYSRSAVQQTIWNFRDTWQSGCLTLHIIMWLRHSTKWRSLWANSLEEWGWAVASVKYQQLLQPWNNTIIYFWKMSPTAASPCLMTLWHL